MTHAYQLSITVLTKQRRQRGETPRTNLLFFSVVMTLTWLHRAAGVGILKGQAQNFNHVLLNCRIAKLPSTRMTAQETRSFQI